MFTISLIDTIYIFLAYIQNLFIYWDVVGVDALSVVAYFLTIGNVNVWSTSKREKSYYLIVEA